MTLSHALRAHPMPFGADPRPDGRVEFRFWAPALDQVALHLDDTGESLPMRPDGDGWHRLTTDRAGNGTLYSFEIGRPFRVPDPASRHQPRDVHGPSQVIDPFRYGWSDAAWTGRPWEEAVLYELHVGTFTPEGTFRAAIDRLDHLVDLGVTAVELMPVAEFPGERNWGYDGALPFAPDAAYGRPEDLKALVDAAHRKGLMAVLDVVYNHFGPDGNYLGLYAPDFFTDRHHTPWGVAINFDGDNSRWVREFFIHNALYWLEEYHFDGLRLDAVHAIIDDSPKHILSELAERVRERFAGERDIHLVLENDANEARFLERLPDGRPRFHTAQWNDDLHHALHVGATGETDGYYEDFTPPAPILARILAEGFAYQGQPSSYRHGEARGEPSAHLPPTAFVGFIQNHDQVGNRAFGERLTELAPAEAARAVAAIHLMAPMPPLLFMGEEWAASTPFLYFCDFTDPDLAASVRRGRREEFARFPAFQDPKARERIPDPLDPNTLNRSRLDWEEIGEATHRDWLAWYRAALSIRRDELVPRLKGSPQDQGDVRSLDSETIGESGVTARWRLADGNTLTLFANLGPERLAVSLPPSGRPLLTTGHFDRDLLDPWSVVWILTEVR